MIKLFVDLSSFEISRYQPYFVSQEYFEGHIVIMIITFLCVISFSEFLNQDIKSVLININSIIYIIKNPNKIADTQIIEL